MNQLKKKRNINSFDRLIIFFIVLQVFGGYGGFFQPVRVFIICSLPWIIKFCISQASTLGYRYELNTYFIWVSYAIISLLWVIVPIESIKEIIYLFINFSGFFLLIFISQKAVQPKESIMRGWVILFVLTIPIALGEFWFDKHLSISKWDEALTMNFGYMQMKRNFASVTFNNMNSYSVILTFILPFIMGGIFTRDCVTSSKRIGRFLSWMLLFVLVYFVIMNGSRGALLCLMIAMVILLKYYVRSIKTFIILSIAISFAVVLFFYFSGHILDLIKIRLSTFKFEDQGRESMITYGLDALVNSFFMGVGPADFSPTMLYTYNSKLTSPHNFFLEVLVQYGVVIFLLFMGLFFRIINKLRKNKNIKYRFIVIVGLFTLPISFIITSGYIVYVWSWLYIASLLIIADKRYDFSNIIK